MRARWLCRGSCSKYVYSKVHSIHFREHSVHYREYSVHFREKSVHQALDARKVALQRESCSKYVRVMIILIIIIKICVCQYNR
jgi:hypothetical protein